MGKIKDTAFGKLIKPKLKKLHMTQAQFANAVEVTPFTISEIINNRHMPRFDTMCIIAKGLGISMNEMAEAYWEERDKQ